MFLSLANQMFSVARFFDIFFFLINMNTNIFSLLRSIVGNKCMSIRLMSKICALELNIDRINKSIFCHFVRIDALTPDYTIE